MAVEMSDDEIREVFRSLPESARRIIGVIAKNVNQGRAAQSDEIAEELGLPEADVIALMHEYGPLLGVTDRGKPL